MIASMKQTYRDPLYGAKLNASFPEASFNKLTDNDCTVRSTTSMTSSPIAATKGSDPGFWNHLDFYFGPLNAFQWHENLGITWTGPTTYSISWGPDCYLTSIPGYYGKNTWCGVYNPQVAWELMPDYNFQLFTYYGYQARSGWMRYYAYSNGSQSSAWGNWN
jgi:hypothetical protein